MGQTDIIVETTSVSLDDLLSAFKSDSIDDTIDSDEITEDDVFILSDFSTKDEDETTAEFAKIRLRPPEQPSERKDEVVTHKQLFTLFDTFVDRLKQEQLVPEKPQTDTQSIQLKVSDRTDEIDELKSLLIEAQETIIKLLTDRVEDRSKIAMLEAQIKYLPMQRYTETHADQLRSENETMRMEISKVQTALNYKSNSPNPSRLREASEPKPNIFTRLLQLIGR
jgi:hypothetical protein